MIRSSRSSAAHGQAGTTLVEVMVALVVFAIGAFAIAGFLVLSLQANRGATHRTRADQLLRAKIEELQSIPYEELLDGGDRPTLGGVEFVREWTVVEDQPIPRVKTIDLSAEWRERDQAFEVRSATLRSAE